MQSTGCKANRATQYMLIPRGSGNRSFLPLRTAQISAIDTPLLVDLPGTRKSILLDPEDTSAEVSRLCLLLSFKPYGKANMLSHGMCR